jgi:hypothetical protein
VRNVTVTVVEVVAFEALALGERGRGADRALERRRCR